MSRHAKALHNAHGVRYERCRDIFRLKRSTEQEECVRGPDRIRVVGIALRVSLAAGFLSSVADRFGWWAPLGQGTWGSMGAFADYTHQLVPFASGWFLTVIVWGATATETALGILLLIGWRPRLVGAASCLVLLVFAVSMAVSLGMESPLSYSVFSAASGAAAYAILGAASPSPTAEATPVAPNVPGSAKRSEAD
jgi:uncharacterized membrane protein YphA (DoxX/SURF4 family)